MALDLRAARATAQFNGQGHPKIEWVQAYATQGAKVIHRRRNRKQRSSRLAD